MRQGVFIYIFFALFVLLCPIEMLWAENDWSTTVYGAVLTGDSLHDVFSLSADFNDSFYLSALAVGRRIGSLGRPIDFEIEGQIVKHLGDQRHMEFNSVIVARWVTFPWDSYLKTSLAAGTGLSLATKIPEIEKQSHSNTSRFLGYLLFELSFSYPSVPNWSLVTRVHHRSGAFGLFNDVRGASNALGAGIRYTFSE